MKQKLMVIFITTCILGQGVTSNPFFKFESALDDRDSGSSSTYAADADDLQRERNREARDDEPSLNMFLELDDNQRDLLKGLVQRQEDRKCTGDRCGSYERSNLFNDIDGVLDEIKKQINSDRLDVRETDDLDYADTNEDQNNLEVGPHIHYANDIVQQEPAFQDLTRNDYIIKFGLLPLRFDSHFHRSLDPDIFENERDEQDKQDKRDKPSNRVNPEDLFKFYVDTKSKIVSNLLKAVRSLNKRAFLAYSNILSENQLHLLKKLQHSYNYHLVSKKELEPTITNIMFGEHSNSRIQPHNLNSFKIFVPQWFYDTIVEHKDIVSRSQKRLLPLTNRQKAKLVNKVKGDPLSFFFTRKNFNPGQFGVPFEFDVQGLGQFNP